MLDQPDVVPGLVRGGEAPFSLVRRGYHPEQVDAVLAELDARVADLTDALTVAEHSALDADARATEAAALLERGRPTWDSFGGRVAEMLRLAEDEATELRAKAVTDAARLRDEAAQEAEELRRGCEGEVDALRGSAYAEAEQVRTSAAQEAAQVREAADRDADLRLQVAVRELEAIELRRDDALRSARVIRDNLDRLLEPPQH